MFAVLRTTTNGSFKYHYTFKLGGKRSYQLQAIAPREGGYANASGASTVTGLHER